MEKLSCTAEIYLLVCKTFNGAYSSDFGDEIFKNFPGEHGHGPNLKLVARAKAARSAK